MKEYTVTLPWIWERIVKTLGLQDAAFPSQTGTGTLSYLSC